MESQELFLVNCEFEGPSCVSVFSQCVQHMLLRPEALAKSCAPTGSREKKARLFS